MQAQRRLGDTSRSLTDTMSRLSSGLRINRAADDAAGLAISSSLQVDSRIYGQAIRNFNDGVSLLDIAEGALNEMSDITVRIRELATQSANGVYSVKQRNAFDKEADQLVDEYNRILSTTTFNGVTLLDGTTAQMTLQGGAGQQASLTFDLLPQNTTSYVGLGTMAPTVSYSDAGGSSRDLQTADLNGDGFLDMIIGSDFNNTANVLLGNGDGSFKAEVQYAAGGRVYQTTIADFNGDGKLDIATANHSGTSTSILLNNGNGTFKAATNISIPAPFGITSGDVNGDGISDIVATQYFNSAVSVLLGNGNGTFQAIKSFAIGPNSVKIKLADLNEDSILDIISSDGGGSSNFTVLFGNGNGTFRARTTIATPSAPGFFTIDDFNDDGHLDYAGFGSASVLMMYGNGDGTFKTGPTLATVGVFGWSITTGDLNSDGARDIIVDMYDGITNREGILAGNGDGTFKALVSTAQFGQSAGGPSSSISGDINGDGVDDIVRVDTTGLFSSVTNAVHSLCLGKFNLNYRAGALAAMPVLDRARTNVLDLRGRLGSTASRVNASLANLAVTRENFTDAASRITDADVAIESATLVRLRILQQAGTAILANAAKEPELALKLLNEAGRR